MEKTVRSKKQFEHASLYQVAETAVDMRRDLFENIGGIRYKNHRVFTRRIP